MAAPVVLNGTPVGKFKASWILTKEAFRFLRADSELLLLPVAATLLLVALFAVLILVVLVSGLVTAGTPQSLYTIQSIIFIVGSYFLSAYVVALVQFAVTYTVAKRVRGENSTLSESIWAAVKRTGTLMVWAAVSSTVGLILRQVSERSEFMSRVLAGIFGVAWNMATYFVMPAMVIEQKGTFAAMTHGAQVLKKRWGDVLVTTISIGLLFGIVHVLLIGVLIGSFFVSMSLGHPALFLAGTLFWIIFASIAFIVQLVLNAIVTTLLYVYATAPDSPKNFNTELLDQIVLHTNKVQPTTPITPVS